MNRAAIQREKLLNAMIFFAKQTRYCHKMKLYKLLYFLDFKIFRLTGRSTTGLEYFAWKMGPVPKKLHDELEAPKADMNTALLVSKMRDRDTDFETAQLEFRPRRVFNNEWFTTRELEIMKDLAFIFRESRSEDMSLATHVRGEPWDKIYRVANTPQACIPYTLTLDPADPEAVTKEQADLIEEEERELLALLG